MIKTEVGIIKKNRPIMETRVLYLFDNLTIYFTRNQYVIPPTGYLNTNLGQMRVEHIIAINDCMNGIFQSTFIHFLHYSA